MKLILKIGMIILYSWVFRQQIYDFCDWITAPKSYSVQCYELKSKKIVDLTTDEQEQIKNCKSNGY